MLCLSPGSAGDVLHGHLEIINIKGAQGRPSQRYDALSYVWGNSTAKHVRTKINGHTFDIAESLAFALVRLRRPATRRYIWVDCLCINQQDIEEKSSQVGMMYQIFSYAERTCVDLGAATEETAFGFRALKTLRVHPTTGWTRIWDDPPPLVSAGINDIMRRPWWNRIWCIQEAVVAQEVVLICGPYSVTWSNNASDVYRFSRSLKAAVCSPQWAQHKVGDARLTPLMEILRLQLESGPERDVWTQADRTSDLLDIAYDMRDRLSSDPRDKLFGLVGLARSSGASPIDIRRYVDYNKDNMTAFSDLARTALPRDPFNLYLPQPDLSDRSKNRPETSIGESEQQTECQLVTRVHASDGLSRDPGLTQQRSLPNSHVVNTVQSNGAYPIEVGWSGLTSTSHSMKLIQDGIVQGMAAVKAGNIESAAEAFIRLGQSMRSDSGASCRPCHSQCERDT